MTIYNEIDPEHQPARVMIARGDLVDDSRDGRKIPYKMYYPAEAQGQALPLVIWSHGLGGSRDGAGFLVRFIASHGYVVLNVTHRGTDSSLWEGKPGHPWDIIRATEISEEVALDRFRDIPFVIDSLDEILGAVENDAPSIDSMRIGMSGHSFGALTTQIIAGQRLGERGRYFDIKDDRIKAGISYSPVIGENHDDPHEGVYGPIDIPMLYMTGTDDSSPISGWSYEHRLSIYEAAGGNDQHLMILDDADHMVFAGSRGKLGVNPKRAEHENLIKIISLLFWDAYLREDENALSWLKNGAFSNWFSAHGRHTQK